jgi:hypothetical protein
MADRLVPSAYGSINAALTAALTAAGNGDHVRIQAGATYGGEDLSGFSGLSNITITNETGSYVTVTLTSGTVLRPGAGWTIDGSSDGMKIRGGSTGYACGHIFNKTGVEYIDCDLETTSADEAMLIEQQLGSNASCTLTRCTIDGYYSASPGSHGCVRVSAIFTGTASLAASGCLFRGGAGGVVVAAKQGTVSVLRSVSDGCYAGLSVESGTACDINVDLMDVYSGTYGVWYRPGAANKPAILLQRMTMDVSAEAIKATTVHSNANAVVRGCWGDDMERFDSDAGTWDYNGYVSMVGTSGGNDVTTLADPGFTDMVGHDYTLAIGSTLIDAGYDTGHGTDIDGLPTPVGAGADIGSHEYQGVSSGIDSITVEDAETVLVDYDDNGAGSAPVQVEAEDPSFYGIVGDYAAAVWTATRVTDFSYRLVLSRPTVLAEGLTLDTSAIATTSGQNCDTPGTLGFAGVQYEHTEPATARFVNRKRIRVEFSSDPWVSDPFRPSALTPANWQVQDLTDSSSVAVQTVSRNLDGSYDLVLAADAPEHLYRVTTTAIATEDGGHA